MSERGALIVVSGFAGAGKGSVVKQIVSKYPNYALSISMTTRSPRPGEVDGREYFFVTKDEFEEAISDRKLLEYANYVGNYYGTPKEYVEEQLNLGKDVILEIEIQGALQVKSRFPDAVLMFVTPPSAQELYKRLTGRATETQAIIDKRMSRAFEESKIMDRYDYLLINDNLDECVETLHSLIEAAHHAPSCNIGFIENIGKELEAFK